MPWQLYTVVASSHGDNNFTVLGLLEKLNTTGEVHVYLWYNSYVEINLTTDVLLSGNWLGLIVFTADQVLHILVNNQCARTVFACLGNSKRSGSNDINQRAGVNMNSGISSIHGVLNVGLNLRSGTEVFLDQFHLLVTASFFICLVVIQLLQGLTTAQ